jgi:hypothetical protein
MGDGFLLGEKRGTTERKSTCTMQFEGQPALQRSRKFRMAKKKAGKKAVKAIEKAVKKAVRKGVAMATVEKAVDRGIEKGAGRKKAADKDVVIEAKSEPVKKARSGKQPPAMDPK